MLCADRRGSPACDTGVIENEFAGLHDRRTEIGITRCLEFVELLIGDG
jgi:hypothetical protein